MAGVASVSCLFSNWKGTYLVYSVCVGERIGENATSILVLDYDLCRVESAVSSHKEWYVVKL